MAHPLNNYLKTHRKRAGFSQDDIASLVGLSDGARVSHYEQARRVPSLETAFAYEALFGIPARDLFPGMFATIQHRTRARARHLADLTAAPCKQVAFHLIA